MSFALYFHAQQAPAERDQINYFPLERRKNGIDRVISFNPYDAKHNNCYLLCLPAVT